jgi:hypothetical protein
MGQQGSRTPPQRWRQEATGRTLRLRKWRLLSRTLASLWSRRRMSSATTTWCVQSSSVCPPCVCLSCGPWNQPGLGCDAVLEPHCVGTSYWRRSGEGDREDKPLLNCEAARWALSHTVAVTAVVRLEHRECCTRARRCSASCRCSRRGYLWSTAAARLTVQVCAMEFLHSRGARVPRMLRRLDVAADAPVMDAVTVLVSCTCRHWHSPTRSPVT